MNKSVLALFLILCSLISVIPAWAANNQTGDNKFVKASKAVGRGIMWGPKKVGNGMKSMAEKTKEAFHKNNKPHTTK